MRLQQVVGRHGPVTSPEHPADDVGPIFIEDQLDPEDPGQGLAGDVVLGRPESATADDDVAAFERPSQHVDHPVQVVAHLDLQMAVDPRHRQL